jgi:CheY-like chemotaxis protein
MKQPLDLLLVDDAKLDVALFQKAVDRTGLEIHLQAVTSGQQAINYLQAKGQYQDRSLHPLPDVIVLDLNMPGLNGFDLLAWRKVSVFASAIPVVVFSGSRNPDEVRRVFELGADRHIVKPEHWEEWKTVVEEIWDFATRASRIATTARVPDR